MKMNVKLTPMARVIMVATTIAASLIAACANRDVPILSGIEPERISKPYDSNFVPPGVRTDLPAATDANGLRDVFYHADDRPDGRIVHFRIPEVYVTNIATRARLPRHAMKGFGLEMLWPDLSPDVDTAMKRNKGRIPKEMISVGIEHNDLLMLNQRSTLLLAQLLANRNGTRPWEKFEDITPPPGFNHGIRHTIQRTEKEIEVTEYFLEWQWNEFPVKFLMCWPTRGIRPCSLLTYSFDNAPFSLYLSFNMDFLPQLPDMLARIRERIASYTVATYPAIQK